MVEYRIEDWSFADWEPSAYRAPEDQVKVLHGVVHGHPRFNDGERVVSSPIIGYNYPSKLVYTRNSTYRLGKIDPGYVAYMRAHGIEPKNFKIADFQ